MWRVGAHVSSSGPFPSQILEAMPTSMDIQQLTHSEGRAPINEKGGGGAQLEEREDWTVEWLDLGNLEGGMDSL